MIYSVSTKLEDGKGGISTALVGFRQSNALSGNNVRYLCSHDDAQAFLPFWRTLFTLLFRVKPGDVVWFHCAQWLSMLRKYVLALVVKAKGGKVVFHFHSPRTKDYLLNPRWRWLPKLLAALADGMVVLTPWWQKLFSEHLPAHTDKVFVCPNPLDSQLLQQAEQPHQSADDGKLFCMARLVEEKGVQDAIRCLSALPESFTLTIAGDGPYRPMLESIVTELGLQQRVTFVGWLSHQQKVAQLLSHNVFILPSRYDSFGMSFIEAMACGVPVVALARDAIPDVVPHKIAGWLSESAEPEALAEGVGYCSDHCVSLGKRAKDYVHQQYNPNKLASALQSFLTSI
jgi:glycosyltransferase involved in cell wall biosynthesis